MGDLTRTSDRIMQDARAVRDDNRAGGRHRRMPPIGRGSGQVRRKNLKQRLTFMFFAFVAIFVGAGVIGMAIDGIGFVGVMLTLLALVAAVVVFSNYPKIKTPKRADLNKGDVGQMVTRTELWLEAQRPALPAPAARIVDDMGVQLDALGLQLEGLDQNHPKAREVRSLVGEQLPEMIDSYRRIPANLRGEKRSGETPDQQLTDSLSKISGEIDSITRQLAEGSLDDLAIRHRFLDYKFGSGQDAAPQLKGPDDARTDPA